MLEAANALTDDDCRGPSRLLGWTRGHLLTHLARNAQSHIRLFECAGRGEIGDQYANGMSQRNADIEAGANRSAVDLLADLRSHTWGLEGMWARATAETWQGHARRPTDEVIPISELVFLRWREVAVHLIDLDIGIDHHSWSDLYVQLETDRHLRSLHKKGFQLPAAAITQSSSLQLAWIMQRASIDGVEDGPGFQI